jgi:hypothetical protein
LPGESSRQPRAPETGVRAVEVEPAGNVFWQGLAVTVTVSSALTGDQLATLTGFVAAWYELGVRGGFGPSGHGKGVLHHLFGPLLRPDGSVQLLIDMGSAPQAAFDGLVHALGVMRAEAGIPVDKVLLGEHADFTSVEEFEADHG